MRLMNSAKQMLIHGSDNRFAIFDAIAACKTQHFRELGRRRSRDRSLPFV